MPQPLPINPHTTIDFSESNEEDEIRLRRLAIEVVAQLPHNTADAQRVLELAHQVLVWRLRE